MVVCIRNKCIKVAKNACDVCRKLSSHVVCKAICFTGSICYDFKNVSINLSQENLCLSNASLDEFNVSNNKTYNIVVNLVSNDNSLFNCTVNSNKECNCVFVCINNCIDCVANLFDCHFNLSINLNNCVENVIVDFVCSLKSPFKHFSALFFFRLIRNYNFFFLFFS